MGEKEKRYLLILNVIPKSGLVKRLDKGSEKNKLYFQAIRFMLDLLNSIEQIRSNSRLFRVIRD